ncbi:hypothetical protein ACA910_001327, partial [Epithemia clementina (nom. ined.)]
MAPPTIHKNANQKEEHFSGFVEQKQKKDIRWNRTTKDTELVDDEPTAAAAGGNNNNNNNNNGCMSDNSNASFSLPTTTRPESGGGGGGDLEQQSQNNHTYHDYYGTTLSQDEGRNGGSCGSDHSDNDDSNDDQFYPDTTSHDRSILTSSTMAGGGDDDDDLELQGDVNHRQQSYGKRQGRRSPLFVVVWQRLLRQQRSHENPPQQPPPVWQTNRNDTTSHSQGPRSSRRTGTPNNTNPLHGPTTHSVDEYDDSPDATVIRRSTKALRVVRIVLLVVLPLSAAWTTWQTYRARTTTRNDKEEPPEEDDDYHHEKDSTASSAATIGYTVGVAWVFLVLGGLVGVYDWLVRRRHALLQKTSWQSRALLSSLFPRAVRGRLLQEQEHHHHHHQQQQLQFPTTTNSSDSGVPWTPYAYHPNHHHDTSGGVGGAEAAVNSSNAEQPEQQQYPIQPEQQQDHSSTQHHTVSGSDERRTASAPLTPPRTARPRRNSLTSIILGKQPQQQQPSSKAHPLPHHHFSPHDEEQPPVPRHGVAAGAGGTIPTYYSSQSPPIAELFPHTTVLFLDIAGFTAWSSEREPTQVFQLLETLYQSFDDAASRLGVFKIETIGDSYVAVTGLPDPREDHAVVMARFAHECLRRMRQLTKALEVQLGPSTGDLQGRVGLHSGSVTGGVLRGQKARFQLFGDTMNTAARMESTGIPGQIQISAATADLLRQGGKDHWVTPRDHLVAVKGKGEMQTYWVDVRAKVRSPTSNMSELSDGGGNGQGGSSAADVSDLTSCRSLDRLLSPQDIEQDKTMRLVEWNVELLCEWLQSVVAHRSAAAASGGWSNTRQRL